MTTKSLKARLEPAGEYPPLPEPLVLEQGYDPGDMPDAYTADQMRAYVDADRTMRALAAPAVADKQLADALDSLAFYRRRCELLQSWQSKMRDPERTIVCDILANGQILRGPDGQPAACRYALAAPAAVAGPSLYQVMAVAKAIHATTPDADDWDSLRQWEVDALRRRAEKVLAALVAAPTTSAGSGKGE